MSKWLVLACVAMLTVGCSKPPAGEAQKAEAKPASSTAATPEAALQPGAVTPGSAGPSSRSGPSSAAATRPPRGAPEARFNFSAPDAGVAPSSRSPARAAAPRPAAAPVPSYPNAGVLNDPFTGKPMARQVTREGTVLESGLDEKGKPFTRVVR
ncbi:hypothetical protein DYH09_15800 [bacterium CPR1]|nr:hypothetical protein [bacterium CPR1]